VITLEEAKQDDAQDICNLINLAYRGESGWTKESDIVAGDRTTLSEIESLILNPNAHLMVTTVDGQIVTCICVENADQNAYIGTFAVDPKKQGKGLGRTILSLAEEFAISELKATTLVMAVVSQRPELIAYYIRRGYQQSGRTEEFPTHLNVGTPKVAGLTVDYLIKESATVTL